MNGYGKSCFIDLHDCDVSRFNRRDIDLFFAQLCHLIDMERCTRYWWDDVGVPEEEQQTDPHTRGTSAVQFILTSDIRIHTLELLGVAYVDVFSCKDYDHEAVEKFTAEFFGGSIANSGTFDRL